MLDDFKLIMYQIKIRHQIYQRLSYYKDNSIQFLKQLALFRLLDRIKNSHIFFVHHYVYKLMSILTKNFQKQKESLNSKHLEDITEGINRIRFIENRVIDKGNIICKLLSTSREITTANTNKQKRFITNDLSSRIIKRPLSQLSHRDQQKNKNIKEQNILKALKLKVDKKQIKIAMKKKRQQEFLQKLAKKRIFQKKKQTGKIKINTFFMNRANSVKQFKLRKVQQKKQKLLKGQQFISRYEKRLIIAQKIKQIILSKYMPNQIQDGSQKQRQADNELSPQKLIQDLRQQDKFDLQIQKN